MKALWNIEEKAPAMKAKAWFPERDKIEEFNLSDYSGKWVIITFYPGDFTFVCATDIEAFMSSHEEFRKNGAEENYLETLYKKAADTLPYKIGLHALCEYTLSVLIATISAPFFLNSSWLDMNASMSVAQTNVKSPG